MNTINSTQEALKAKGRPQVFIPNKGCHDFSKALDFGTPVILTQGKISILSVGRMYRVFQPHIDSSSPEDYILITGPSIMCSILCSMFSIKHNRLNLLIYQNGPNNSSFYKQRIIHFNEGEVDNVQEEL